DAAGEKQLQITEPTRVVSSVMTTYIKVDAVAAEQRGEGRGLGDRLSGTVAALPDRDEGQVTDDQPQPSATGCRRGQGGRQPGSLGFVDVRARGVDDGDERLAVAERVVEGVVASIDVREVGGVHLLAPVVHGGGAVAGEQSLTVGAEARGVVVTHRERVR